MNEASDGLYAHDPSADEDCGHDCKAGASLGDLRAQRERDSQWHGGEGIAEIVDQVGQQGDAAACHEHSGLSDGGESEDRERQRDGMDALTGALDAVVYEAVGMAVPVVVVGLVVGVGAPMRVGVLYVASVAVAVPTERFIDRCSQLRHGSQATHAAAPDRTLPGLVRYFLKLGSSGFGGPIALVGYVQRDPVETRGWFTEDDYRQGLALAQAIPGPMMCEVRTRVPSRSVSTEGGVPTGGDLALAETKSAGGRNSR
jgi:hypothetical protein